MFLAATAPGRRLTQGGRGFTPRGCEVFLCCGGGSASLSIFFFHSQPDFLITLVFLRCRALPYLPTPRHPWSWYFFSSTIYDTRATHGCRHTPAPMLRVAQDSTSSCSIQYLVKVTKVTTHNHSLRVQYVT